MNSSSFLFICFLGFSILAFTLKKGIPHPFYQPKEWPKPTYNFKGNPLDYEKFELGRALFYDPILSRDSSISCASCHLQFTAFAHEITKQVMVLRDELEKEMLQVLLI